MHLASRFASPAKPLAGHAPAGLQVCAGEAPSCGSDDRNLEAGVPARARRAAHTARAWLLPVLSVALFAIALWVLHRELLQLRLHDVLGEARRLPASALIAAALLTAASYWLLGFYDVLGLHYIRKRVPYARAAFVSFIAFAFGHNLSLAALTGTAVRYRLYGSMGLRAPDVALLSGFVSFTTSIGLAVLAGAALISEPASFAGLLHVAPVLARAVGAALLALVVAYAAWVLLSSKPLSIRGWLLAPPSAPLMTLQLALAVVDLTLSAGVLWMLLPVDAKVGLPAFVGIYSLAIIAGLASNIPGGLGVFEAVILVGLRQARPEALLASLVVYRAIYYLVPLLIATLLFAGKEVRAQRARIARVARASDAYIAPLVPHIVSILTFIAGTVLLLSGFAPALDARLHAFRHALPLPLIELSHLTGSIIGLALLIMSRSLMERVAAARDIAAWLLIAGIVAALLRGPQVGSAATLAIVLAVLWLGRSAFYRRASILEERFTPSWIASIAVVLMATICVGFFAHRHVEYENTLWWTFAVEGGAPRMLRAALITVLLAGAYFTANLLRPSRAAPHHVSAANWTQVRQALVQEDHALGQAALTGDKRFLFADSQDAFLMYQICGRSWIALGDPVGRTDRDEELVWRFRELSDEHSGWPAFYQVRAERLPAYIDLGFAPLKLGEEARVPLANFDLGGSARASLRQAQRRAQRDGLTFEIAPPAAVMGIIDELAHISNAWLATKNTAEKHFSIGTFSPDYLSNFPIALIRRAGSLVAFANLWASATREEAAVDLMRFTPTAPHGTMDYLFVELLLWARDFGYRWFNLGMAPLAGLGRHRLAPRWHHFAGFMFRHGEHFYNFQGLRRYKEKFAPVWESRYLVAPGGLALPRILMDTTLLISGGVRGLLTK